MSGTDPRQRKSDPVTETHNRKLLKGFNSVRPSELPEIFAHVRTQSKLLAVCIYHRSNFVFNGAHLVLECGWELDTKRLNNKFTMVDTYKMCGPDWPLILAAKEESRGLNHMGCIWAGQAWNALDSPR
ncbi:hypothetical protein HYFRA_00001174 [Hymenoscyphus fraxineus]|uniref:Uncharacterized protein n=1 Tax=Hymenoscyphus fraxineus TaxID=746836 RepID=A0A9N9KUU4_9HELO|nr:hypothetical protein HYFRA_00001174 [Hymenoscyphus fraxineus]